MLAGFRKILLFILTAVLMLPGFSFAESNEISSGRISPFEQDIIFSQVRPLADLTVSASLRCSDVPMELPAGTVMPSEYASTLISGALDFGSEVGASFSPDSSEEEQKAWISRNYSFPLDDTRLDGAPHESGQYIGIMMMDIQSNESGSQVNLIGYVYIADERFDNLTEEELANIQWMDLQAYLTLIRDDEASTGWKVASLTYQADPFADDTQQAEPVTLSSYYNETYGFTVLYPEIFESQATPIENGLSALLEDESASFSVRMVDGSGRSLESLIQEETSGIENADIIVDEDQKSATIFFEENDMETYWLCALTDKGVLIAQMRWNLTVHPEFERICEESFQIILPESDDLNG